ncbi:hypothetical protein QA640_42700 [Bradyrhizobium sp. CB82]|uniref:hypothetical protein n=1 Tax=Bradyrhizobium sp. CB82 TaxID=3039159 RepID=UPI0024B2664F|nr:hypothetical protein [Bradyrhizobium sp. CB82]WFU40792.1 hypothetical protein QA640_42700 [Bradyrhizobium sp. CB82]
MTKNVEIEMKLGRTGRREIVNAFHASMLCTSEIKPHQCFGEKTADRIVYRFGLPEKANGARKGRRLNALAY